MQFVMSAVISPLLSIAALSLGCHRALSAWIAVSQLPTPSSIENPDDNVPKPIIEPGTPWIRRVISRTNRKAMKARLMFLAFIAFEMLVIIGLPRIASQTVIDGLWLTLMAACSTGLLFSVISIICHEPKTVEYHRAKPDGPLIMKYTTVEEPHPTPLFNKKVQVVLAFISTAALFTANYYNPEFSQPVLAAAWILHMARGFTPPQIKMKRVVQFLLAVEILIPAAVAIVVSLIMYFVPKEDGTKTEPEAAVEEEYEIATPSPWIANVMMVLVHAYPILLPAVLVALNLRFDYSLSKAPIALAITEDAIAKPTKVEVPRVLPVFAKPHFMASITALSVSAVFVQSLPDMLGIKNQDTSFFGLLITIPVTMIASALAALCSGNFQAWWGYSEEWVPKPAAKVGNNVDDVEKLLGPSVGGVAVDEKPAISA